MWEKISYFVVGGNVGSTATKSVWLMLRELKCHLSYDPAIPLLKYVSKIMKPSYEKAPCIPVFIASQMMITQTWKH